MRADSLGFFWRDEPPKPREKVEPKRCVPPDPVWLSPDYLPGLEEALRFQVSLFTIEELVQAMNNRERLVFDVESYPNYWLVAFMSLQSGKVAYFEMKGDAANLDINTFGWMMQNFTLVSFNGINYDIPICSLALAGYKPSALMQATSRIIMEGLRPYDILKAYKAKAPKVDHIDLIEIAPLAASLKIYGGRLHAPKMQDLPFPPGTVLSEEQIAIVRWYCINDLTNTACLHDSLLEQITLREKLSKEYGIDLRSKSDAQIAEAVIVNEIQRIKGAKVQRPQVEIGRMYKYNIPAFIRFETPLMQWALGVVYNAQFIVSPEGNVGMPPELTSLKLQIAEGVYQMGIGGLHSTEKKQAHVAGPDVVILDRDVTSYYPRIILNQGLFPAHLGHDFLRVYDSLVRRRLDAKERGDKVIADSLKITINGSFGKLASQYSALYSPSLLIQTTITGQLSLLMLIERLELRGFPILSANTDGIVIKCLKVRRDELNAIIAAWEHDTQFETEETEYRALYSRDVNNYIAVKTDNTVKSKGAYANPWNDKKMAAFRLNKNPTSTICVDAVEKLLTKGTPLEVTITTCQDITKFVSVRSVKGGAVKNGVYLGKAIRWYYAKGEEGTIVYASSGKTVPRSEGAMPLMQLPGQLPPDIDYDWYLKESERILTDIAYQ